MTASFDKKHKKIIEKELEKKKKVLLYYEAQETNLSHIVIIFTLPALDSIYSINTETPSMLCYFILRRL